MIGNPERTNWYVFNVINGNKLYTIPGRACVHTGTVHACVGWGQPETPKGLVDVILK